MSKVYIVMNSGTWPTDLTQMKVYDTLEAAKADFEKPGRSYMSKDLLVKGVCPACGVKS